MNHLQQIADTFGRTHGTAARPAPMTDAERQTAHARTSLAPAPGNAPTAPQTEQVPAYALHGNAERLRDLADAQPAPGSPSRTEPCDPRT